MSIRPRTTRSRRVLAPALTAAALAGLAVTVPGGARAATTASPSPATVAELQHAMVTEALAYGQYRAYADAAEATGDRTAADTWRAVADVEHWDHFVSEGAQTGLVGTNAQDVRAAIASESGAVRDYGRWAATADAAGCPAVAATLREIRSDEQGHLALFQQAAAGSVPAGPSVDRVATRPSSPACASPAVATALQAAMESETLAWGQYTQWAAQAVNTGDPRLAALFREVAAVELEDHFATEANLAGLVGSTASNLRDSLASERDAIAMYGRYAAAERARGDVAAADLVTEVRGDEQGHLASFRALAGR